MGLSDGIIECRPPTILMIDRREPCATSPTRRCAARPFGPLTHSWGCVTSPHRIVHPDYGVRHGSQILKQLPVPGVLVTATAPPCSPTSRDTIARPSPVPSLVRVKLLLICVNGVKSRAYPRLRSQSQCRKR
jgi:hypothetical protein